MSFLFKLPAELLRAVLKLLSERDACSLAKTCQFLYKILQREIQRYNLLFGGATLLPSVIGAGTQQSLDFVSGMLKNHKPALKLSLRDRFSRTALVAAIEADNVMIALTLVSRHSSQINAKCLSSGWRPLSLAVVRNQVDVVKALLAKAQIHVNCSAEIKGCGAPLHFACKSGLFELVEMLLKADRIDRSAVDKNLRSALDLAVMSGCCHTVQAVLKNGHTINQVEVHGHNPISEAVRLGNVQILETLIQHKIPVIPPHLGRALQLGNEPIVSAVLLGGIDLISAEWMSYKALSCAAQGGIVHLVQRLLPRASACERRDALLCAVESKQWGVANLIMDKDQNSMIGSIFTEFPSLFW